MLEYRIHVFANPLHIIKKKPDGMSHSDKDNADVLLESSNAVKRGKQKEEESNVKTKF